MKRRDIVIGFVVLLLLAGVVYWRQKSQNDEPTVVPQTLSTQQEIEQKFNVQIPADVDKAELSDTTGGNASGLATRDYKDGEFTSSVLADLPAPASGQRYQAWLVKGNEGSADYAIISMGTMKEAKGGYLLDFSSKTDYSSYNTVKVTSEKTINNTPETTVLEGGF